MKDYFLFLSSASLNHSLLHLLSPPKDLYSSSFISNLNFGTFPLILFLQSQGFFLLPSSLVISIIPLSSPQPSPQWVNYVIIIKNLLHLPTFLQSHCPSFIISQDNQLLLCISHLHRGHHSGSRSLYLPPSFWWCYCPQFPFSLFYITISHFNSSCPQAAHLLLPSTSTPSNTSSFLPNLSKILSTF